MVSTFMPILMHVKFFVFLYRVCKNNLSEVLERSIDWLMQLYVLGHYGLNVRPTPSNYRAANYSRCRDPQRCTINSDLKF